MEDALPKIFSWVEWWSRAAILTTVILIIFLRIIHIELSLSVQIIMALVGLIIGIPHGAIDHLVSIPSQPRVRFYTYIVAYIAIALMAGWAISTWNMFGFRVVVIMSALHFGFGDAAYRNEWKSATNSRKYPWFIETAYALPAGFMPVVLPLTDPRSLSALNRIHPGLKDWAGANVHLFRGITLVMFICALVVLLIAKSFSFALDLGLLGLLTLIAPPLVSFAIYFGFWHAARHTVRLIPKLEKARALALNGDGLKALRGAITPGLYAVAGTALLASGLTLVTKEISSSGFLWSTLVIIWGLTVPHMLTTSSFDFQAIRK
ncbi:MAG: beta-carotene 15,15'-dioxygenase, Brp/Blh family [Actinobacteria bacterium]|nr:beta-carotene 15,15'-dioxygenase, Brp/Blh family [Actinomycetota bacterium]